MSSQQTPDWFLLIQAWKDTGMGEVGITVPFLIGALELKTNRGASNAEDIRNLLHEISAQPVDGFAIEVRRCPNVRAPVLSVASDDKTLPFNSCFTSQGGKPTLGFSANIESKYGGLGCSGADECLEALVRDATPHVVARNYSRRRNPQNGEWEYGAFSEKEKQFIAEMLRL